MRETMSFTSSSPFLTLDSRFRGNDKKKDICLTSMSFHPDPAFAPRLHDANFQAQWFNRRGRLGLVFPRGG